MKFEYEMSEIYSLNILAMGKLQRCSPVDAAELPQRY
jgi:hypothetical protein